MENEFVWNLIAKKLSDEATPEELRELENQLRINPELHYPMQIIIDLWNPSTGCDKEMAHKAFNIHMERMQKLNVEFPSNIYSSSNQIKKNNLKRALILMTPSLIIVFLLLMFEFKSVNHSNPADNKSTQSFSQIKGKTVSEISTKNGSKTNIILPDGTQVWLNAGSKITYDKNYGNNIREVNLVGEAFFDVVHNADKPFVIHAASINIKVLGTKFNVKSYPSDKNTEATLIRGSIEVSFKNKSAQKIILKPNEKIIVSNADNSIIKSAGEKVAEKHAIEPIVAVRNLTYYQHSNDVVETSWVENKLIFQDESFEDLATQLERWYGVTISFKNLELQQLYFTGNFTNESIIQALDALKLSNGFSYTIDGKNITILK